jgi:protein-export membrane protein SecD
MENKSPFKLGVDLAGGVMVIYRPDFSTKLKAYSDSTDVQILKRCKDILTTRLYRKLHIVPDVYIRDDNKIVLSVPSVENYQQVIDIVGKTYRLTFRIVKKEYSDLDSVDMLDSTEKAQLYFYNDVYFKLGEVAFSGDMLDPSSIRPVPGNTQSFNEEDRFPYVTFSFVKNKEKEFANFTKRYINQKLAVLLDDTIQMAPIIKTEIRGGGQITGRYTLAEAKDNAILLSSGNLPVSLETESTQIVGPSLGLTIREKGLGAALLSLALLLLLIIYAYLHRSWFLLSGLVSTICLSISMMGIYSLCGFTLDFGGMAGIILSIGMGMDAFIIIFESLEHKLKRFPRQEITNYIRIIIDEIYSFRSEGRVLFHANITTLIAIVWLFRFDRLQYFAWSVLIGLGASVYTIVVTREVLRYTKHLAPNMGFSPMGWMRDRKVGIFQLWKPYLVFTFIAICYLAFIVFQAVQGKGNLKWGADFKASTLVECEMQDPTHFNDVLNALRNKLPTGTSITSQTIRDKKNISSNHYLLTIGQSMYDKTGQDIPNTDSTRIAEMDKVEKGNKAPSVSNNPDESFNSMVLHEIFSEYNVKQISINSIDSKVSSFRYINSLLAIFMSLILLTIYFLMFQKSLDKFFTRLIPESLFTDCKIRWISIAIVAALIHDVTFILLGCHFFNIEISIAVIGGILTTIGYSVNDSVVLWSNIQSKAVILNEEEKYTVESELAKDDSELTNVISSIGSTPIVKEKNKKKKSEFEIVSSSVDSILSRDFLTSVSTLIPAIVIYMLDIRPLKDFAFTMIIGTIFGTLSSIFIVGVGAVVTLKSRSSKQKTNHEQEVLGTGNMNRMTTEEVRKKVLLQD